MSSPITCNKNVKALSGVPREKKCKTFKFLNKEQYLTSNASCSRILKPKNLGTPKINIYILLIAIIPIAIYTNINLHMLKSLSSKRVYNDNIYFQILK